MTIQTQSRTALHELIALLQQVDEHWCGPERNLHSEADVAGAHRALMHIIEASLVGYFEQDPVRPDFRRIVTPSRKLTGDNSDAIYFDAPITAGHSYLIHGNLQGAVYFSLTIEEGAAEGHIAKTTAGVLNDVDLDTDANGNFTVYLGGEKRARNWLPLSPDASRVTTRHYYEQANPAALDPQLEPRLRIECLDAPTVPAPPSDETIAAGIRRVCNAVRSRTLDMPALASGEMTVIICKCESGNAKMPVITMDPVVIRDRFMKAVQA